MGNEREMLTQDTASLFQKAGFETSLCNIRACYDIIARGKAATFLIKAMPNVDAMTPDYVQDLKTLCYYFKAHPLVIGIRTKTEEMRTGVIHFRDDIPVISIGTLEHIIIDNEPPLVYADRGGFYVQIHGDLLRSIRENMGYSMAEFAKEMGVSRTTLYDYEHSKRGIDLEVAIRLEEILDTPLIKPLSIRRDISEREPTHPPEPRTPLERDVYELLGRIGLVVHPTKRTPFDAVVREQDERPKLFMLTGIANIDLRSAKRRIAVVHELATLLEKDAVFVFSTPVPKRSISGVPIIQVDEIRCLADCDAMLEVVKERTSDEEED